jgi:hypothetical protein
VFNNEKIASPHGIRGGVTIMAKLVSEAEAKVELVNSVAEAEIENKAESVGENVAEGEVLTTEKESFGFETTGLFVEREKVRGVNKKEYRNYFVKIVIRGRSAKVDFLPIDIGGYEVLDFVFGDLDIAELVLEAYIVKDSKSGKVTKRGYYYWARNVDSDGVYKAQIKPKETSDKNLLDMFLFNRK